jgi:DNA repair protein RadC
MKQDKRHAEKFLKGLTTLTGLPYKKIQQYAKENNPFNILEHPIL